MSASIWTPGTLVTPVSPAGTPFEFTSGTDALPGLTFTGDTNTGIYRPGADQVGISVGGANKALLSSSGLTLPTGSKLAGAGELDISSAATCDIGALASNYGYVRGTTNINSFGTTYRGPVFLRFEGALVLANSAALVLPTGANITTAAGDSCVAYPKSTAGTPDGWIVTAYTRANGVALVASTDLINTTRIDVASASTVDLVNGAPNTRNIRLTGTTQITAFTITAGWLYFVSFQSDGLVITNNASIVTGVGGNFVSKAGDSCILRATAANVVEVISYDSASLATLAQGGQLAGFRNRIINGDMRIDQRREGASVTLAVSGYIIDRWACNIGAASKLAVQRVADAPAGFTYSQKVSVIAQYAPGAAEAFTVIQAIEGQNAVDLQSGTATAQTVTISLYVKSSIAGTYTIFLRNSAGNRTYLATITVTTAWVKQTVTLTLDTSGAWAADYTGGIYLGIDMGSGTNFQSTVGVWQAANYTRTSGSVTFVNQVNGSTFNFTGVQLEHGSVATPFEHRSITTEQFLCERFYEKSYQSGITAGSAVTASSEISQRVSTSAVTDNWPVRFKTRKRTTPTVTVYSPTTGTSGNVRASGGADKAAAAFGIGESGCWIASSANVTAGEQHYFHWVAECEF